MNEEVVKENVVEFKINKKDVLEKFKKFINDRSNDIKISRAVSEDISKDAVLEKIKNIYEFVVSNSTLELRKKFIHDDDQFIKIKHTLESYLSNKIRSRSDGTHYINVNNLATFTGDKDQYDEWITKDKRKLYKVVRNVIEELDMLLNGYDLEDSNKSVIIEEKKIEKERIAEIILSKIAEKNLLEFEEYKFKNFSINFINIMRQMKISDEECVIFLSEIVNKKIKDLVTRKD